MPQVVFEANEENREALAPRILEALIPDASASGKSKSSQ
jgi:hypothetical protein